MKSLFNALGKGALLSLIVCLAPGLANAAATYGPSASPAVIAPQVVQQAASQASNLLAGRISAAVSNAVGGGFGGGFGGGAPGPQAQILGGNNKAAGDPVGKAALWMNVGNTWLSNDQSGVDYSGSILTGIIGVDYQFTDNFLAGVAFGYERPNVTTDFNNGSFKGNNFAVSPYAAYIINDIFSVNATVGYTVVNYDTSRANGAFKGDISGHRFFGDVNATAATQIDRWSVSSSAGYMYLLENQDAYTETGVGGASNPDNLIRLGQLKWTNKAGYLVDTDWGNYMPYGSLRLEYDVNHTPLGVADAVGTPVANDRFGAVLGLGVDTQIGDSTTFSVEGTTLQFREHLSAYGLTGTLRVKF